MPTELPPTKLEDLRIPTLCPTLDNILEGGLKLGSITTVFGEYGTGKTTLSLQLSLSCCLLGFKVYYICADARFPAARLERIALSRGHSLEFLTKISVFKLNSFKEQSIFISSLPLQLEEGVKLIVFDAINALYRYALTADAKHTALLNQQLNKQLGILKWLSETRSTAILLTSQVRASPEDAFEEPVASSILDYWSDVLMRLERTETVSKRKIQILKLNSQQTSLELEVELADGGFMQWKSSQAMHGQLST